MRDLLFITSSFLVFLASPSLWAQSDEAVSHFNSGRYQQAISAARHDSSADARAFVARSLLAICITGEREPDKDIIEQAIIAAQAALDADAGHVEGHIQLAIALSLKARPMAPMRALRSGLGEKGRDLAYQALSLDPEEAWAHAFLSAWHIEVVSRGGSIGAGMLGASHKKGRQHYKAAAIAKDEPIIHWQYVRAIIATAPKQNRRELERLWPKLIDRPFSDPINKTAETRAIELKLLIEEGKWKQARKRARQML